MNTPASDTELDQQLRKISGLFRSGASGHAMALLERLSAEHPDHAGLLKMKGIGLAQQGQLAEAATLLARVAELLPDSAMAASDQAHVLMKLGRHDDALEILRSRQQALVNVTDMRDRATFLFNLGRAYKQAGQAEQAVKPFEQTLEIDPRHYGAMISLGDVFKALGEADAAARCFRQAIELNPADGTGWWSLSNLKAGVFSESEVEQLRSRHAATHMPPAQKTLFEFALATACDQKGETEEAFSHYQAGNQLAARREPWDRRQFRSWLNHLQQSIDEIGVPARPAEWTGPRPIFIISLPRSGSTLVEQILAAHSEVTAASELPWIPQLIAQESVRKKSGLAQWIGSQPEAEWWELGRQYLQKCRHWTRETQVFTDKLPGNLPYIGAILSMLPDALVIGVRRSGMDVCWSCYRQLLMGGSEFVYDFQSLADYWQDFESHLDFWEARVPGRVMSVQYENLVSDPETETRRLLDFSGLEFEQACLSPQRASRAVNTASALQVREPIHSRGVGHWHRYAKHLGELERALAKNASGAI